MMKHPSFKSGATFVELLVSITLLSLFLIPLFLRFSDISDGQIIASQHTIALQIGNKTINEYRLKPVNELTDQTINNNISELPYGKQVITLLDIDPSKPKLVKISVEISWIETGVAKKIDLTSIINKS